MSIFVVPLCILGTFHFQLQSSLTYAWIEVLEGSQAQLKDPPLNPTFSLRTNKSYNGKCKERCEKSRGGGPYSFELNCESRYISLEETNQCLHDCNNECPTKICSANGTKILCKAQNKEAARMEREKAKERKRIRLEREKELKELMDTIDSKKTWIFALVMMLIFASFASICGIIVACRVFDMDGDQYERSDKHTSALARLFHRRKKLGGRVVPYVPSVPTETHASGHDVGVGPILIEK